MKTTFKVIDGNLYEYDSNGNEIHYKNSNGYEWWSEYDINGKLIHFKNSTGCEEWYEYDSNGSKTHFKYSDGYEWWAEFNSSGNLIHSKNSTGYEYWYDLWYDSNGNSITKKEFDELNSSCAGKIVTISGKKYQLKLV